MSSTFWILTILNYLQPAICWFLSKRSSTFSPKVVFPKIASSQLLFQPSTLFSVASGLNSEQAQIQQLALDFADKELFPQMAHWDQNEIFPVEVFRWAPILTELGTCGLGFFLVLRRFSKVVVHNAASARLWPSSLK